jgi:hypothetical protein
MLKLAKSVGLVAEYVRPLWFPFCRTVAFLSGNVRGKSVKIFTIRSVKMPTNLVAQVKLQWRNEAYFSATRRSFGVSLIKILGRPVMNSGDIILDRKIVFQANDSDFARKIFEYEEIREKFDALFSHKFSRGALVIGESSIFYREPSGILSKKKRQRFAIAVDLLCDLFDVLYFHRYQIS